MKYEIKEHHILEMPIGKVIDILKDVKAIPEVAAPERSIYSGQEYSARIEPRYSKGDYLIISWSQSKEISKDGKVKKVARKPAKGKKD